MKRLLFILLFAICLMPVKSQEISDKAEVLMTFGIPSKKYENTIDKVDLFLSINEKGSLYLKTLEVCPENEYLIFKDDEYLSIEFDNDMTIFLSPFWVSKEESDLLSTDTKTFYLYANNFRLDNFVIKLLTSNKVVNIGFMKGDDITNLQIININPFPETLAKLKDNKN